MHMTVVNRDPGDETSYIECNSCLEEALMPYLVTPDGSIVCRHCYRRGVLKELGYADPDELRKLREEEDANRSL
jgi:hypothetical protein